MSVNVKVELVTIYQVMNDDNDGNPVPSGEFAEDAAVALEKSKPGTWSGQGREPNKCEAIKFPDGTIRLLGDVVITIHGSGERARRAERDAAKAKLTRREREILGIKE